MQLETQADAIKDREISAFGYRGKFRIRENSDEPCFKGRMSLLNSPEAEVSYNPKYKDTSNSLERVIKGEPFEQAVTAVIRHELNHRGGGNFRGCPRNLDLHTEEILEPAAETLQRLGFSDVPVSQHQTLYAYFANLVEDFIENSELGNKRDHVGMALCYKDDASHTEKGKFPALFDAFVGVQEYFYGGKRSTELLKPHRSGEQRVNDAIDGFLEKTGIKGIKREVANRKGERKEVFDRRSAVNYILNEANWRDISVKLTEEFSKLIDKSQLGNVIYVTENFIPLSLSDGFNDEMKNPEARMKFAVRKYEKAKGSKSQFSPPAYMDSFEALDLVYQRLARDLEIKTRPSTTSVQMPLVGYGKRQFDPEKDKVSRVKARLSGRGDLELTVKAYHEHEEVEYTERMPHPPTIKFVKLDTSGSMKETVGEGKGIVMNPWTENNKQWTDASKYHHSLLAFYGLIELARRQGTLKHDNVLLANYSTATKTADNLADAKKLALTPQFGSTNLDMDKIRDMFGKGQLVISTSDGGIENWSSIKNEYIRRARENQYFHIQMGDFTRDDSGAVITKPQMCKDLEAAGLHVYYEDGKNLGKLVLDIARPYVSRRKVNGGEK